MIPDWNRIGGINHSTWTDKSHMKTHTTTTQKEKIKNKPFALKTQFFNNKHKKGEWPRWEKYVNFKYWTDQ